MALTACPTATLHFDRPSGRILHRGLAGLQVGAPIQQAVYRGLTLHESIAQVRQSPRLKIHHFSREKKPAEAGFLE